MGTRWYTKIKAAHMATNSGVPMVITSGEVEDSVRRVCRANKLNFSLKRMMLGYQVNIIGLPLVND